jgi:uncharacterized membrane protein
MIRTAPAAVPWASTIKGISWGADPNGVNGTRAFGINSLGAIVGQYRDTQSSHGFLLSGGTYTTIQDPLGFSGAANGINDPGDIVGFYFDGVAVHGFLLSPG